MATNNSVPMYPIINPLSTKGFKTKFDIIDVKSKMSSDYLTVTYNVKLDSPTIEEKIKIGDLSIVFVVNFKSFRGVYLHDSDKIKIQSNLIHPGAKINVRPIIVSTKNLEFTANEECNPFYKGYKFNLKKHQILGYATNFTISTTTDTDSGELFKVLSSEEQKIISYTFDDQWINIILPEKTFNEYQKASTKPSINTIVSSLYARTALAMAANLMVNKSDEFESKSWYIHLKAILEDNELSEKDWEQNQIKIMQILTSKLIDKECYNSIKAINKDGEEND